MNPLTALEQYLREVKRRLQITVAASGLGVAAAAALGLTVACVLFANHYAFANWSVIGGRLLLFGAVAAILAVLLIRPLLAMRGRRKNNPWVRRVERRFPVFEERLQTFVDRNEPDRSNPLLGLLAEDTLRLAVEAPPSHVAPAGPIWTFVGIGAAAVAVLIWLGAAGPGYLGYGTARLWAGWFKPSVSNLYQIVVEPGSATVRRKADLLISAKSVGFYSPTARLFARFSSSARWEEAPMQRRLDDTGFEFLFAGIEEPLRYYIAAGGVKSSEYEVRVVEMPNVKRLRLTYHYPAWSGLPVSTEEPGGDVRGVAGTEVDVEVETDRPLPSGVLRLDNQANISLRPDGNWSRGRLSVEKDSRYFVAALYNGEVVRLSGDFFIEAVPDRPPVIRVTRPGRDYRATSIEEVTARFEAEDDFGLKGFQLRYAVNGGPEKTVGLAAGSRRQASTTHVFPLEDFGLVPGDVVTYHAVAGDAKVETKTDMYFIEVQPFEREFYQSQQMGGGGGGGGDNENAQISRRQKEIVAATWNLARQRSLDRQKAAEDAKTLSGIQSKLRDQSRTLAERMKRRQLAAASGEFRAFVENMEKATEDMGAAADKLGAQKWQEALPPEQKALQHLLRAESIFRQIQVAFGSQGGGGGSMGRDLAEMFDLELDTTKNQYETGPQASAQQRDRELDQALEKLRELARRQEQLAREQRRQQTPTFDQRWQQEMLRREAEELARQLQQVEQQQQGSQSARSQQQGSQSGRGAQSAGNLERALERLQEATRDMQPARGDQSSAGGDSQQQGARQRAQERLREAEELLTGERRERTGEELEQIERRASDLAGQQRAMAGKLQEALRQALQGQTRPNSGATGRLTIPQAFSRQQAEAMAREKEQLKEQMEALERRMQEATRSLAPGQPNAARQLRETLSKMQQDEIPARLRIGADLLRRGMGLYAAQREEALARAFDQLRSGLKETRRLAQGEQQGGEQGLQSALSRVERLRQQLEQALTAQRGPQGGQQAGGQPGQQQGREGQGQQGQQGGQGQQGQTAGQQGGGLFGTRGGGQRWGGAGDASNRGDWRPDLPGRLPAPTDPNRAFREGQIELGQIERALRNDPEFARDVEQLRREMQKLGNAASRFPGNPALLSREQQKLLFEVQELELMMRRKLDEKQGAQVRAATEQPVPEQYRKAVAEYFRRLSKEK